MKKLLFLILFFATPLPAQIVISTIPTTLETANGFYRVEASNMGCFSTTALALSTVRTISVTFANAGNCQGIVLMIWNGGYYGSADVDRSVTVTFQQNIATVWTTVQTVTLTANQITNTSSNKWGIWTVPFPITPTAVTTAASTWRFQVIQSGGSTGTWYIKTSDGTNPFYATWCDNAVSFADFDAIIVSSYTTINTSATFRSQGLGTGETTRSIAAIVCRNTNPTSDNVALLKWENPAVSSYVLTLDGYMVLGAHSGFRAGTAANPIAKAQMGTITFDATPTYGSAGNSGIVDPFNGLYYSGRGSLFIYGEIPAVERALLNADANVGATAIVTDVATGWVNGDTIYIGGQDTKTASAEWKTYTVNNTVGTTVNLTGALTAFNRKTGGIVFRLNGYGMTINQNGSTSNILIRLNNPSNFVISGTRVTDSRIYNLYSADTSPCSFDAAANRSKIQFTHSSWYTSASGYSFVPTINENGFDMSYVNGLLKTQIFYNFAPATMSNNPPGVATFDNLWIAAPGYSYPIDISGAMFFNHSMTNCKFQNCNTGLRWAGTDATLTNTSFYGCGSGLATQNMMRGTYSNLSFDNCTNGIYLWAYTSMGVVDVQASDISFGQTTANTYDIAFTGSQYTDLELIDPLGNITYDTTYLKQTLNGTHIKITNHNATTNDDRGVLTYGYYQRTGDGLGDTTAWCGSSFSVANADQFAMRFQPTDGTSLLTYLDNAGQTTIGNCNGLTVTVTARIKINNAAYYAGTYILPTLKVYYDNNTKQVFSTATATTDAQQLQCVFAPATASGFIKIQLDSASDAATSNAYWYLGELVVNPPPGVVVDTTRFGSGSWSSAVPLGTTRTFPAPDSPWNMPTSAYQINGSFGKLATDTEIKADDAATLSIGR